MSRSDTDILEELKDRFDYGTTELKDIREEARIDMRYVSGDCWDPTERKAREDLMRPVVEVDELSQYLNQGINDLRQNKRGIKVTEKGSGATKDTARWRQGKIRDIEYVSNAQQAYLTMAENVFQRSYGFLRIKPKYVHEDKGFDQELIIEPVVNPDNVTPDPDHQRPDGTDLRWLVYHEDWKIRDFKRKYSGARITDFDTEVRQRAQGWFKNSDTIQVGEYWTKEPGEKRKLLLLKPVGDDPEPLEIFEDEFPEGYKPKSDEILKSRPVEKLNVVKYITNGVEVLERVPWLGPSIPWVTCYGKVLYIDEGNGEGAKRKILSMIRLARSPQMLYAYYRTQQAEMAGMIPKTPVVVYKGQMDGVSQDWAKAAHEPVAFLQVNPKTAATGEEILPLPQRLAYEAGAHLQALELCAEGARRAIQAAMGISPLPTSAQRKNEKSGVALREMKDAEQIGSFHFVDHYDESVMRCGAILEESLKFYYDTARETSVRKPDDSVEIIRINDPQATDPKTGQAKYVDVALGDHDVTIAVGPAQASEREAASEFADGLLQSKEVMVVAGPQRASKMVAAAIRLKNVGPIGDEMAELFDPKDEHADPAKLQQQAGELQQQLQQTQQQLQQAVEEIKTDRYKVDAQVTMKKADLDFQRWKVEHDSETKIAVAELGAKVDRLALFLEERARLSSDAHEVGMSAMEHQHALQQGQQATVAQGALAEQGQGHALEAGDQSHQQALEQGDAAHAATLAQQQQAADLAPQPEAGA